MERGREDSMNWYSATKTSQSGMRSYYSYVKPQIRINPAEEWLMWTEDGYFYRDVFELVPINEIEFDEWNPSRSKAVMEKIQSGTSLDPVRLSYEDGKYSVSDGNHRCAVSKRLGYTHVPAIVTKKFTHRPYKKEPIGVNMEILARELQFLLVKLRSNNSDGIYYQWHDVDENRLQIVIEVEFIKGERDYLLEVRRNSQDEREAVLSSGGENLFSRIFDKRVYKYFAIELSRFLLELKNRGLSNSS